MFSFIAAERYFTLPINVNILGWFGRSTGSLYLGTVASTERAPPLLCRSKLLGGLNAYLPPLIEALESPWIGLLNLVNNEAKDTLLLL
ncbi:MAG: hypothetical protein RL326_885 [Pseudomonadota bacterium]